MEGGHFAYVVEDSERKWLDTSWRRVFLGVTAKLAVQTEINQGGTFLVARVQGPHTGEALTDGAEVVLHCSRSDRFVAGVTCKGSCADSMGKDLEKSDFVSDVKEQGALVEGDTKGCPDVPVLAGGSAAARNDSGLGRFFCKAEITAELIFDLRGQSTQD